MRGFVLFSASILASSVFSLPAAAESVPDLSPLTCAWDKLSAEERARLTDEFKVELNDGGFTLYFGAPNPAATNDAARECQLNLAPPQLEHLGLALARRGAEEKAKSGITEKGENPETIRTALGKMNEDKREIIGNKIGCPGPHPRVTAWDQSVASAVRRANLRFKNDRARAWVSLGLYAIMGQEGAIRRMSGQADAC